MAAALEVGKEGHQDCNVRRQADEDGLKPDVRHHGERDGEDEAEDDDDGGRPALGGLPEVEDRHWQEQEQD